MTLVIDKEFQGLIPHLSEREYEGLEQSIINEGCRDRLVVWDEQNILVDGHNRYLICRNHDITFDVTRKSFPDREAVADWIDANQLGRRNLTPDQVSLLRGRRYNREKKAQGGDHKSKGQNDPLINAAEKLSKQYGVSPKTIKRDGRAAEIIEQAGKTEAVMKGAARRTEVIREILKTEEKKDNEIKDKDPTQKKEESINLKCLKLYWRSATKRERSQFMEWLKTYKTKEKGNSPVPL